LRSIIIIMVMLKQDDFKSAAQVYNNGIEWSRNK